MPVYFVLQPEYQFAIKVSIEIIRETASYLNIITAPHNTVSFVTIVSPKFKNKANLFAVYNPEVFGNTRRRIWKLVQDEI